MNNPFAFYASMFDAGLQMAKLAADSAQVIGIRGNMMTRALQGEVPLYHKEFTGMWLEKFLAGGESMSAALIHMKRMKYSAPDIEALMAIMAPFSKRAAANAKRLNKV
jgi:hypothetical protein